MALPSGYPAAGLKPLSIGWFLRKILAVQFKAQCALTFSLALARPPAS
jgi:hypothetical protein